MTSLDSSHFSSLSMIHYNKRVCSHHRPLCPFSNPWPEPNPKPRNSKRAYITHGEMLINRVDLEPRLLDDD